MVIGSGDLLPGVADNPTFPIISALAYTTGWAVAQPVIWPKRQIKCIYNLTAGLD